MKHWSEMYRRARVNIGLNPMGALIWAAAVTVERWVCGSRFKGRPGP